MAVFLKKLGKMVEANPLFKKGCIAVGWFKALLAVVAGFLWLFLTLKNKVFCILNIANN